MRRRQFLSAAGMAALVMHEREGWAADLELSPHNGDIEARFNGREVLQYRQRLVSNPPGTNPLLASNGYIHPVHAPNGAVVTNHFSPDHLHQRGIFSAWTKTTLKLETGEELHPDFWNIQDGKGRTRCQWAEITSPNSFRAKQLMEVHWTFKDAKHDELARKLANETLHDSPRFDHPIEIEQRDEKKRRKEDRQRDHFEPRLEWVPVLSDEWSVRFPTQRIPEAYVFDITSTQTPHAPLILEKYHYGGFAIRGSGQWVKGSDMQVLTSEGKGRVEADNSRPRWIDMSGTVDGKMAGIALLEHPQNAHAPNGVRMHPDMPYFVFAPPQSGPITLEPDRHYVTHFRVVAHNGRADRDMLDTLWREFAGI